MENSYRSFSEHTWKLSLLSYTSRASYTRNVPIIEERYEMKRGNRNYFLRLLFQV